MPEEMRGTGDPPAVLIVEDNETARRCLARLLTLQGYKVETAGTFAVAAAELDGQAVVLLDLNLPDGIGTELLQAVRAHHPQMHVVILSGAAEDLLDEARALGPDLVMRKPADVPALLKWLDARRGTAGGGGGGAR